MKATVLTAVVFLLAAQPTTAMSSAQVEGVEFQRVVKVGDSRLVLQGYGLLRYMVFIKAYVGALYLPEAAPADSRPDVFDPVAKRLELEYFHAIKKEDFAQATRRKIADNVSAEQAARLEPHVERLAGLYRDVRPGDRYALTFLPGVGTELSLNGEPLGTIAGEDFAAAVFAIWLGANPIDRDFRDLLLGAS